MGCKFENVVELRENCSRLIGHRAVVLISLEICQVLGSLAHSFEGNVGASGIKVLGERKDTVLRGTGDS